MAATKSIGARTDIALVTGAAQGIGFAIARAFALDGRPIAICDMDAARLDRAASNLGQLGSALFARRADVTEEAQVNGLVDEIERDFGPITVLVNNAGITGGGPSETYPVDEWRRLIDVNLTSAFICARAVGRRMLERSTGVIVNVASIYGMRAAPERAAYVASKHGIIGLTEALAVEWAPRGVRVNAVAPGYVGTELFWSARAREGNNADHLIARIPAGRIGNVEDIANAVRYLSSPDAMYVTGHTLVVDGGWLPNGAASAPDHERKMNS